MEESSVQCSMAFWKGLLVDFHVMFWIETLTFPVLEKKEQASSTLIVKCKKGGIRSLYLERGPPGRQRRQFCYLLILFIENNSFDDGVNI